MDGERSFCLRLEESEVRMLELLFFCFGRVFSVLSDGNVSLSWRLNRAEGGEEEELFVDSEAAKKYKSFTIDLSRFIFATVFPVEQHFVQTVFFYLFITEIL